MMAELFIDQQAREDLLRDAMREAILEAERQQVPQISIVRLYARCVITRFLNGMLP